MKYRCAIAAILLLGSAPIAGQDRIERVDPFKGAPVQIKLDAMPTNSLVVMLMRDVMGVPYVVSPDVLNDKRPVSVNLNIPRRDLPVRIVQFLRSLGMTVTLRGGTVYVTKGQLAAGPAPLGPLGPDAAGFGGSVAALPAGSPLAPAPVAPRPVIPGPPGSSAPTIGEQTGTGPEPALAVYVPANRDVAYLATTLEPLFPSVTWGARAQLQASPSQQAIYSPETSDVLMMVGPPDELQRVRSALSALDRPRALVAVKAVVMQVSSAQTRGSALSLLASVAGGRIEAGSFADLAPGGQFLRISTGALSAVLSAVNEDNRFRVVASPNLSALSGSVATLNAGAQVPTLGAVTVSEGTSTQAVVYRDSGITLEVRPVVRGGLIHLEVRQERSNFVPTTTGVEDSPTLQTASVSAQAILRPGESIALAGLTEDSNGNRREGLLGGLLGVRSRDKSESELLVMLQADLVPAVNAEAGQFIDLGEVEPDDA